MPALRPSPTRSALIAQLLKGSQQPNQGSGSLAESLNIAARPIVAALLGKQEEAAQQQQQQHIGGVQSALVNALSGSSGLQAGQQGPGLDRANPASIAAGLAGIDPQNQFAATVLDRELTKDDRALQEEALRAEIAQRQAQTGLVGAQTDLTEAEVEQTRNPAPEFSSFLGTVEGFGNRLVIQGDNQKAFIIGENGEQIDVSDRNIANQTQKQDITTMDVVTLRRLEQELETNLQTEAKISELRNMDPRDFLSVQGKVKSGFFRFKDLFTDLSSEQQQFLLQDQQFRGLTSQLFADIRREVTGAQAAQIELEVLEQAFISTNMTPTQYQGALDVITAINESAIDAKTELLNSGIRPSDPEFSVKLNEAYIAKRADANAPVLSDVFENLSGEGGDSDDDLLSRWAN